MKQTFAHKIDLTNMEGNGDFSCPRCGTTISPDDETEETYTILEARVNAHGLEEVVIRCKNCESRIHITGFSLLRELEHSEKKPEIQNTEESLCYISHI